jgi:hypothetical protein
MAPLDGWRLVGGLSLTDEVLPFLFEDQFLNGLTNVFGFE